MVATTSANVVVAAAIAIAADVANVDDFGVAAVSSPLVVVADSTTMEGLG